MKTIIFSIIALFAVFCNGTAQNAEVVYGKLMYKSSNATYPIASAKVQLCSGKDTLSAFTDSEGNVAFYNVKVKTYQLKAVMNNDTLSFIQPNKPKTKAISIVLKAGSNNFGKINAVIKR
jgi:hypothetical protein